VTVPRRLAAFALVLAAAFGVGAGVGAVVGPIDVGAESDDHEPDEHSDMSAPPSTEADHEPHADDSTDPVPSTEADHDELEGGGG